MCVISVLADMQAEHNYLVKNISFIEAIVQKMPCGLFGVWLMLAYYRRRFENE